MIDNQYGRIVLECDSCNEVVESERGEDWKDSFWPRMKREGWRTRQIGNQWLHGCLKHGVPR